MMLGDLALIMLGDHCCWRCTHCYNRFSVRHESFFEFGKLPLKKQMHLLIAFQSGAVGISFFDSAALTS